MPKGSKLEIPKIDLHCHLDGSLPLLTVVELLGKDVKIEELQAAADCKSLAQYLEKFDLPLQCLQTQKALKLATYRFLEDVAKEQIKYIEVRFAPMLSTQQGLTCKQVIEAVLLGMEKGKHDFNIRGNVIACAMRHHSEEQNMTMIMTAREFLGAGLVAVDLAGNEAAFPMTGFRELFQQTKRLDMPFTIHAGECKSVQNVVDAVNYGAARIGHGIALKGNRDAQKLCQKKRIGIEMCPTSNLQTKAIDKIKNYPMEEFISNGLYVTINTDNRTVSNTTIGKEIELAKEYLNQSDEDIKQLMKCAVEVSFSTEQEKHELLKLY